MIRHSTFHSQKLSLYDCAQYTQCLRVIWKDEITKTKKKNFTHNAGRKKITFHPPQATSTMTTIVLIKEAITALKDRTGSSIPAITKWLETEKKVSIFERKIDENHSQPERRKRIFFA